MKIFYPDSLDSFNLKPPRAEKNAAVRTNALETDDLVYIVNELERKVGANNSTDPLSLDAQVGELRKSVGLLASQSGMLADKLRGVETAVRALTYRSRRVSVTSAGTTVLFPFPMEAGYILLGACYNAGGETIGFTLTDQRSTGFTITPDDDGTFEWIAIPNS